METSKVAKISSRSSDTWFREDNRFHQLYPAPIRALARLHWTPLHIARSAAEYLVPYAGVKVLDIGSGVGAFCLAAAYYQPSASFSGVEQRKELVNHAEKAKTLIELANVHFLHGNFTQLDFKQYDHFYFYNSFHENLTGTDKIDDSIAYSVELYNYYNRYLYTELEVMATGTRIVTYHSLENEIPRGYQLVEARFGNLLKCWMKI
ncbi:class I SAM-dependent methyltransferase [Flavitalea flava]